MEFSSFIFVCLLTIIGATINQNGNNRKINDPKGKSAEKEKIQKEIVKRYLNGGVRQFNIQSTDESQQIQKIALIEKYEKLAVKAKNPQPDSIVNSSLEKPFSPINPAPQPTSQARPNNTNNQAPSQTGPMRSTATRGPKKTGDSDGNEDGKNGTKKSPNSTQLSDIPIKTSDPWGGGYMLPTQTYKPRWMRNDTSSLLPNIILVASSFFAFLFFTAI
jgi:hypothetical protein